ncbi:glycosyl transferase [Haloferula helveola]|uniref:Glycosyl transferase n=1 Tax=Haloferula helveola TaxID=490095 RepID=A0ABN6H5A3_9BACT|nr:glycosyl transferase [Haloferula helveola]
MKLIIQIPCLNEEATLPLTLADLPREVPGIDVVELLVIDDGSTDRTSEVAKECGAHHVLRLGSNRGLATAFRRGVDYALAHGADIVVNTDGDNQYCGADIPKLVEPVLRDRADIVVGSRPIVDHPEFGAVKKLLQLVGSWVLRMISKTSVRDAPSGFRAFSREACMRIFLYTRFSYCMETLIQAGNNGLRVESVDIRVNPKTRDSRLFRSVPEYVCKTGSAMLSLFILYRPSRLFFSTAGLLFLGALALGVRFIYLVYFYNEADPTRTHLPSIVLLAILALAGCLLVAVGILAELGRSQRRLAEETLYQSRLAASRQSER